MPLLHLHFGLEGVGAYVIYFGAILSFFLSIVWRPSAGLYFIVPLLPLQTARYRVIGFPGGAQLVDFCLLGVFLGLLVRRQLEFKTPFTKLLVGIGIFTYISLWLGSVLQSLPPPLSFADPRFSNWKNFMVLPWLFFLVVSAIRTPKEMRVFVIVMCAGVLILCRQFHNNSIDARNFSSFSYVGQADGGQMGYAGVNGLAAFLVQFCLFIYAMALVEKKWLVKLAYWGIAGFCGLCMMYALSRGAYVAFLCGFLYLAVVKQRALLVCLVLFLVSWQAIVPGAVVERVMMTYKGDSLQGEGELDNSAQERVELWQQALEMAKHNFVIGMGFNTFEYVGGLGDLHDTHNLYMKFLAEYGIIGTVLFITLFVKFFITGRRLYRRSADPFLSTLGFGFSALAMCVIIVNCFGDRWNYLQVSGYTWALLGLVVRGLIIEEESRNTTAGQTPQQIYLRAWGPSRVRFGAGRPSEVGTRTANHQQAFGTPS